METKKGKTSEIKFLSSIIQENTSLRGRIAILTYENLSHSNVADRIIIFIEHFQSMALFVISNYRVFPITKKVSADIFNMVHAVIVATNPSLYMPLNKEGTRSSLIIALIAFLMFWLKLAVFGYIVIFALRQKTPSKYIQQIWQWIFKLQIRVTYFFVVSIWANIIAGTFDRVFDLTDGANTFFRILGVLMFVLEFGFSLVLNTQFTCILPNKSFLSSKNNITPALTLSQKFISQLVRRVFSFAPVSALWFVNISMPILSVIRIICYFSSLPYYKIDCLFYEMYFLVINFSLNIACLLQNIFGQGTIDLNLLIGIWVILSILSVKIGTSYLKERLLKTVLEDDKKSHPEALVHKVIATRYFLTNSNQSWFYLVKTTLKENIGKAFNLSTRTVNDLENKESRNQIFSIYLEDLLARFPKNDFLRLYAAYHFAKKQRLYGKCLRAIHELKNTNSWRIDASMSVLFQEIKSKILSDSRNKLNMFDVSEFALSTSFFAQVKLQVLKQIELQADFYKEMKESSPLLTKLNDLGQEVATMRKQIETTRKRLLQVTPEYYLEPLLLYAYYELALNHSYERFSHYYGMYTKRHQRYAKVFSSGNFCQEIFYKKGNGFFIFSGEKKSQGKILYCGGNYEEIFGRNISGSHFGITVPTITMSDPRAFFNLLFESSGNIILNRVHRRFFYHQDGYMTEMESFFNISPFISQGLTYFSVFQPVKTVRECILLNREGMIECFTKGIGEQLNLFSLKNEEKSIGRICPELELVNEAFNIVNNGYRKKKNGSHVMSPENENMKAKGKSFFVRKGPMMNLEEAQEICSGYKEEGGNKIIHLERVNGDMQGNKFAYRCRQIKSVTNNSHGAKEIYLERIHESSTFSREIIGEMTQKKNVTSNEAFKQEWDECPEVYENEKEAGWIDFQTLDMNFRTTSNPDLQSPLSSARHLLTSSRSIKQTQTQTPRNTRHHSLVTSATEEAKKNKNQEVDSYSYGGLSHHESVFSLRSEVSGRNKRKNQRIFEQTNLTFYKFPRYKFLTFVLYAVLAIILVLQQIFNWRVREGFDDLESNKEIVLISESRNYYISYLSVVNAFIYGQAAGLLQIGTILPGASLVTFKGHMNLATVNLTKTNSDLFGITNSLNDAQREILFRKDVRVFDVNSTDFTNFTSFEATNQMIESALRVKDLMLNHLSDAISDIYFIGINSMNDLLDKSTQIADEFFTDLQDRKHNFIESLKYAFLGITIVPIGGLITAYSFIFAQYKIDLKNMFAFTKINKNAVERALVNLTNFQAFIQQNTNFENIRDDEKCMSLLRSHNIDSLKNQDSSQIPDTKGFTKVYFVFAFKVLIMLLLITISFLVYYLTFTNNLTSLGDMAYQLYYLERVLSRIIVLRTGAFEMTLSNDTARIHNVPASVALQEEISALGTIQHQLQYLFNSQESQTDDLVQNIMFNDACQYIEDQAVAYAYCKKLGNYQNKASWINLISNIKELFQEYYSAYESSDKSPASLSELGQRFVQEIMKPLSNVANAVNNLLTENINSDFSKVYNQSLGLNNVMPFLYVAIVLLTFYVGLYHIIGPLNSKENRFRQLLLLFPANVVLSNFMLKSYLLRVSKGAFDSIRNEL